MTPIATVERDAKLEGKNMFMILAPRAVPTGPPKFTQPHHDAAATAAASAAIDAKAEREEKKADTAAQNGATEGVISSA